MIDKNEIKNALKDTKLARPMDRTNMANDDATLRALAGQLNNPRASAIEKLQSFAVDTTKYSGPTGTANMTIPTEQIPDESTLPRTSGANPTGAALSPVAPPPVAPSTFHSQRAAPISNRLVFTGRELGLTIIDIGARHFHVGQGVYSLAQVFFNCPLGDSAPSPIVAAPGAQSFIDTLRAWGTGEISQAFPVNATRALFVTMIHSLAGAKQLPGGFDWAKYGKDEGFWIDSAIEQAKAAEAEGFRVAFTGIKSVTELNYFRGIGCSHWHITGSPGAKVDEFANALDQDVIRQLSKTRQGPKLRCIWRSPAASPSPRLWSVQ
jgi:hypothetical protein